MTKESLEVKFFSQLVGYLHKEDQELGFTYSSDYLTSESAVAISISLPLQDEKFIGKVVEAFFGGFLPEAEIRIQLAKKFGISEDNDYSLLNKLGGECAGAISVGITTQPKKRELLDSKKILNYFKQLPEKALLSFQENRRLSLAGAQQKLVVLKDQAKIYFPATDQYSTHILKPVIKGHSTSVHNEYFCMKLAARLGLKTPGLAIDYAGEIPYLEVERYDRQDGIRLHQEDFTQALGILTKYKYQNEGGPSYKDCFELLRANSKQAASDTLKLLELVIFNFLIANNDAHGKNFSLLYRDNGRSPELAPCYDLLCTAIYPGLSEDMAMKLGKDYKYSKVRPSDWEHFAEEISINKKYLAKKLDELSTKVLAFAEELAAEINNEHPSIVYFEIIKEIKKRAKYCFL
jgi:serine/threonine-protein kinase HipA